MYYTPETSGYLLAVKEVINGTFVPDLDEKLRLASENTFFRESKDYIRWNNVAVVSSLENRILNGEYPAAVYEGGKVTREEARELLVEGAEHFLQIVFRITKN